MRFPPPPPPSSPAPSLLLFSVSTSLSQSWTLHVVGASRSSFPDLCLTPDRPPPPAGRTPQEGLFASRAEGGTEVAGRTPKLIIKL